VTGPTNRHLLRVLGPVALLAVAVVAISVGGCRLKQTGEAAAASFVPLRWEEIAPVHDPVYDAAGLAAMSPQPTPRPEVLQSMSGRRVEARGFVVGLEATSRGLKRFILVRHRAPCCFGRGPLPSVWIDVTLPDGREIPFDPYRSVEVRGRLRAVVAPSGSTYLAMEAVGARPLDEVR
jgi:hypothetical protein